MAGPATSTDTRTQDKTRHPPPWNVVLLDDNDHSYEYVIRMMQELFALSEEAAFKIAQAVDKEGRAVCLTTHKERAEFKRDQILAYGKDPSDSNCKGSMTAVIEPAEFDGDGGDKSGDKSGDKPGDRPGDKGNDKSGDQPGAKP